MISPERVFTIASVCLDVSKRCIWSGARVLTENQSAQPTQLAKDAYLDF